MRIFHCDNCLHTVYFENTVCERCGTVLGYDSEHTQIIAIRQIEGQFQSVVQPQKRYRFCKNHAYNVCNWLIDAADSNELCIACRLNKTIPNLETGEFLEAWKNLEFAKHRLIYNLNRWGLPYHTSSSGNGNELAFSFLSQKLLPDDETLYTGHSSGLITIKVSEADAVEREQIRTNMKEPYRTLIGHFRHEVGHYYWDQLIRDSPGNIEGFRNIFGDERIDYAEALQNHYNNGVRSDWQQYFISTYASSHPWEDWAETWAHYLHIVEIMDTAHSFGITINAHTHGGHPIVMKEPFDPYKENNFDRLTQDCLPLTIAVNSMNRSMGQPDLYPFVVNDPVVQKLRFIHEVLWQKRP